VNGHPDPPPDFSKRRLPVTRLRGAWYRIHRTSHAPLHFGKAVINRFDAPAGEFGVLYLGRDVFCAFIETFGHATGIRIVDRRELAERALSRVDVRTPLRLLDLRGNGLARIGADAELTSGADYPLAQRWSKAIHDHQNAPDGILYRARHDPARVCAAVFERAARSLTAGALGSLDSNTARLADLLDTYDFGLL
jgi:hypothetical protein